MAEQINGIDILSGKKLTDAVDGIITSEKHRPATLHQALLSALVHATEGQCTPLSKLGTGIVGKDKKSVQDWIAKFSEPVCVVELPKRKSPFSVRMRSVGTHGDDFGWMEASSFVQLELAAATPYSELKVKSTKKPETLDQAKQRIAKQFLALEGKNLVKLERIVAFAYDVVEIVEAEVDAIKEQRDSKSDVVRTIAAAIEKQKREASDDAERARKMNERRDNSEVQEPAREEFSATGQNVVPEPDEDIVDNSDVVVTEDDLLSDIGDIDEVKAA